MLIAELEELKYGCTKPEVTVTNAVCRIVDCTVTVEMGTVTTAVVGMMDASVGDATPAGVPDDSSSDVTTPYSDVKADQIAP